MLFALKNNIEDFLSTAKRRYSVPLCLSVCSQLVKNGWKRQIRILKQPSGFVNVTHVH